MNELQQAVGAEERKDAPTEELKPVETENSGSQTGETQAETQEPKKPNKVPAKQRINQLTHQKKEALTRAEQAEQRAAELEKQLAEATATAKPNRDDYEDESQYETDLIQWAGQRAPKAEPEQQHSLTAEETVYIDKYQNTMLSADDAGYEDFDTKVQAIPVLSFEVVKEVIDTDASADILYYFANNHDVAERLSGLEGNALVREVGKIEAQLAAGIISPGTVNNGKPSTQAPEPIDPVPDVGSSQEKGLSDELPAEEWMKRRRKQRHG